MGITLDMYMTAALGLAMYYLGRLIRSRVRFLEAICVPVPVVGGLLFALVNLVLHQTGILRIAFDETLKDFFMMVFYTTVGFHADLHAVTDGTKRGGKDLLVFLLFTVILIVLQDVSAVFMSLELGLSPLFGMCAGSVAMVGGHGTAAAFGPLIEEMGLDGAPAFAATAATFGLVAGSLSGGPMARHLIRKFSLCGEGEGRQSMEIIREQTEEQTFFDLADAVIKIIIAMGIGSVLSRLADKSGLSLPAYLGAMAVAAVMRNLAENTKLITVPMPEINGISSISLNLFLSTSMITLQLWQLEGLALPLLLLLSVQVVLILVFTRFVLFPGMGKNYDAAVMAAGLCGFGLGATPNALANMQSVCEKYRYSEKAFLIIPLVGSLFVDVANATLITLFLNLIR